MIFVSSQNLLLMRDLSKFVLLFFYLLVQPAYAEYFEVAPEGSEWNERFCQTINNSPAFYGRVLCEATGGQWLGLSSNPVCTNENYSIEFNAHSLDVRVEKFAQFGLNMCSPPSVVFSGWGEPTHSSLCWNSETKFRYGVPYWETGNFQINGVNGAVCSTPVSLQFSALRTRSVSCPTGSVVQGSGDEQRCYINCPAEEILIGGICVDVDKDCDGEYTGNPCNVANGNKYRSEADFTSTSFNFTRSYNSRQLGELGLGKGWRHNFQKSLIIGFDALIIISETGRGDPWTRDNGVWSGDEDSDVIIVENANGFELTKANGVIENYDLSGQLLSQTNTNGHQTTYTYDTENNLLDVENHYGETVVFAYQNNRLDTVIDSLGAVYRYEYDTNNNLETVVFPDGTPADDSDNPRKIYHYENSGYPNHLTGITDENGERFATFAFGADGKAVLSELGTTSNSVGQQKIELNYQGAN